jgi:hypothetical protein
MRSFVVSYKTMRTLVEANNAADAYEQFLRHAFPAVGGSRLTLPGWHDVVVRPADCGEIVEFVKKRRPRLAQDESLFDAAPYQRQGRRGRPPW